MEYRACDRVALYVSSDGLRQRQYPVPGGMEPRQTMTTDDGVELHKVMVHRVVSEREASPFAEMAVVG